MMSARYIAEGLMGHKLALAPQVTTVDDHRWITIGDVVILTFTLLGASAILLSMLLLEYIQGRPTTTRTRIVQALIFSDFLLGLCGLASSSLLLHDPASMQHGTANCSGLGFMFVIILWTEHLWTLTLACATFMILIYPLHIVTLWLEKRWYYLWAGVWLCALAVAIVGLEVYGYYPSGGVCYYGDNAGLYAELIQFLPRCVVCITITVLYARLFVFLRRPDKIRLPGSGSFTNATRSTDTSSSTQPRRRSSRFGSWLPDAFRRRLSSGPEGNERAEADKIIMDALETPAQPLPQPHAAPMSSPSAGVKEEAPWERLELPPFQINGERFGGGGVSTPGGSHTTIWGGWKGMGTKKRPSTASSFSSARSHPGSRKGSTSAPTALDSLIMTPGTQSTPLNRKLDPIPSVNERDPSPRSTPLGSPVNQDPMQSLADLRPVDRAARSARIAQMSINLPQTMSTTSEPYDQISPLCTPTYGVHPSRGADMRRPSATELYITSPRSRQMTGVPNHLGPNQTRNNSIGVSEAESAGTSTEPLNGNGDREDNGEEEEEGEWDLMKMLAHVPPGSTDDRFAPPDGEEIEFVPESMASYLNRKTALLMLWFPIGYVFLFSVSLVRLIYDFAGRPPAGLRAVSRWMVLSQGLLDALIYGLVEWHTKRVVRKKVRRGTFSPRVTADGSNGVRLGNAASAFRNFGSKVSGGRIPGQAGSSGPGAGVGSAPGTGTGSSGNSQTGRNTPGLAAGTNSRGGGEGGGIVSFSGLSGVSRSSQSGMKRGSIAFPQGTSVSQSQTQSQTRSQNQTLSQGQGQSQNQTSTNRASMDVYSYAQSHALAIAQANANANANANAQGAAGAAVDIREKEVDEREIEGEVGSVPVARRGKHVSIQSPDEEKEEEDEKGLRLVEGRDR